MYIRAGIRPSVLARKQFEEIKVKLPQYDFEAVVIATAGDRDKETPLSLMGSSDFFTREIERALVCGEIDIAVHSAKDMEEKTPEDLMIAAMTASIATADCLFSPQGYALSELPRGSRVGTSSINRTEGIAAARKDLVIKNIRGNVDERIAKVYRGEYDALIVAQAALMRLGIFDGHSYVIAQSIVKPHPLQGRLAVQVRKDRKDLIEIFRKIHEN